MSCKITTWKITTWNTMPYMNPVPVILHCTLSTLYTASYSLWPARSLTSSVVRQCGDLCLRLCPLLCCRAEHVLCLGRLFMLEEELIKWLTDISGHEWGRPWAPAVALATLFAWIDILSLSSLCWLAGCTILGRSLELWRAVPVDMVTIYS